MKIQIRGIDSTEVAQVTARAGGRVLDATESVMILEVTDAPRTVAAFIDRVRGFGLLAVTRSGRVVMPRGDSPIARAIYVRADGAELEHQDATGWSDYLMPVAPTPFRSQADGASDDAAA